MHCEHTFSRKDARTKHSQVHHDGAPGVATPDEQNLNGLKPPRKPAKTACKACRRLKVRCLWSEAHDLLLSDTEACPTGIEDIATTAFDATPRAATMDDIGFADPEANSVNQVINTREEHGITPGDQGDAVFSGLMMDDFLNWFPDDILENSLFGHAYSPAYVAVDDILPKNVQSATSMTQAYHRIHSGTTTPTNAANPRRWFSDPPSLQVYDDEIVNVFLNLAAIYITPTFPVFKDLNVRANTVPELYLAMAAVGGLFCQVPGSFDMAKALYHDSRRLLLASFILLEIYGLCSGDKRSYEFVKAFHTDTLQVWQCTQAVERANASVTSSTASVSGCVTLSLTTMVFLHEESTDAV
ncbi:hypothetical protein LTR86_010794 [Recurvomyces mirabilis]|nr:hypothetical protein LTR86_010794 [Recurvomyces mirabilis]